MPSSVHSHQALFYTNDREYLEGLTQFLKPAVAAGDPVALALPGRKLELARECLGDAPYDHLLDMSKVGRNPGRILSVIDRLRDEHPGQTLHYVGEPIWPGRAVEEVREAVRHEALINLALRGTTTRVLCPYDASGLDDAVLESAARTHPVVVERGTAKESSIYSEAVPPECEEPLTPPPDDAVSYDLEEGELAGLRAAIRRFGGKSAPTPEFVEDLQLVGNELATNAVQHGSPPRQLMMWRTPETVVCQVENEGPLSDPLAGRRNLEQDPGRGMGLWIVHHLSDLVELRNGRRTTVRARIAVG